MNIGWIGVGKMGLPICQRFKAAGHHVCVLARSETASQKMRDMTLNPVPSIVDLCENADIVFSSISNDAALLEILDGVATLKPGVTYIDISTVSPAASAEVAKRLSKAKINYLRSPVSGSTAMARAGMLTAVVSGPKSKFNELAAIFEVFAKKAFHVGESEEARYLKLVLNSMVAATSALLGEALALGQKGGLSNAAMLDVINQSAVASPLIGYKTDMIVSGDYSPAATLDMLKKDLDLFLAAGVENDVAMPINSAVKKIYDSAANHGLGERDFFVLVQQAGKANIS